MSNHLFNEILDGNTNAYSVLYTEYFKRLYNYGRKFTNDTLLIEDCIQEIFLNLWSKKESLSNIESADAYLFSSFRYTLLKKIKRQSKTLYNQSENEEIEFSIENLIVDEEIDAELKQRLFKALKSLTGRQLEAIFLRYYQELSYDEVAAILNISVKATYKIVGRSISNLKEELLPLLVFILIPFLKKS